jgi:hypothetical protein
VGVGQEASVEEGSVDEDYKAAEEALGGPPVAVDHPVERRDLCHGWLVD